MRKKFLLILCLLAFTGAAYAEANYNRNYSPLSVGETDKYFKDLNSWDSRNLYGPGQPYNQPYDYSYQGAYDPSQFGYRERTIDSGDAQNTAATPKMYTNQGANVNAVKNEDGTTVKVSTPRANTGYRWGKNPYEIYYNFGATGFKSKGYGQDYGQK
mgnify:FL=1